MDYIYKQPKYFKEFRCIGGECPETCCRDWSIDWKIEDLDKIRSTSSSDTLNELIQQSFELSDDKKYFSIKLCADGRCPFLNRNSGLCDIQKELGEEYLGRVCRQYPRHYIEHGNQIIRWCVTSCPAVTDILFNMENAVDTEKIIARDQNCLDRTTMVVDHSEAIKMDPIKQVRMELFDFYTDMLLDKKRDLDTSIILTALAVKHFTDAEKNHNYSVIPQMANDLKKQLNNMKITQSVEDLKPNYQLKFKLVNNMLVKFFGNNSRAINISALHDGKQLNIENYLNGIDNFNKAFDNKPFVLNNIIMNTFYDLNMPIGKFKRSLFENYSYFVLTAATYKTVASAIGFSSDNIINDFKLCVSEMNRCFSHTVRLADMIIEDMLQTGITTPAHLALIIKG